jgi:predicted DNA-binding transcriptional regulator AlpA
LVRGGTSERGNLQPLCRSCHAAKSLADLTPSDTAPEPGLIGLVEIAERLGVKYATARRWFSSGLLPPPIEGWGWRWADIEQWGRGKDRSTLT